MTQPHDERGPEPPRPRRVAVAGGTGLVGALVVAEVRRRGHEAVVLARATGVDVATGTGLDEALDGVDAVVDVLNSAAGATDAAASVAFFESTTRHLLDAGARVGVRHHLALSIVGCDRVDLPYYAGKRRQEQLVEGGAVPWSILRATQFHEFADQMAGLVPGPVAVVPGFRCRPVAAREVARHVVDLVLAGPAGRVADVAGPQEEWLPRMARRAARHRGRRRLVVPLRLPGAGGRQVRAGGLLPGPDARNVGPTHDRWLAGA